MSNYNGFVLDDKNLDFLRDYSSRVILISKVTNERTSLSFLIITFKLPCPRFVSHKEERELDLEIEENYKKNLFFL